MSINQFVATAVAEKLAALMAADYLQERAKCGDRKAFEKALSRVPATEPEPLDRIDAGAGKARVRPKRPKPSRKPKAATLPRRSRATR